MGIDIRIEGDPEERAETIKKQKQKDTVRWVLDTPWRLRELLDREQDDEAESEWEEVSSILDKWQTVAGVKELREECEAIMQEREDSD